ncbi:hypothetical protein CPB84DRAFT_1817965 [Gymnopilus junonius]|uniref:non-specific serine/threonine protein kinase n=1 Tax=Gymnopilus junonius TaxID=109634 RepID=A0A9P5NBJ7_GYMJU|nr:hypothetical protein CPB84DRAFT_1817965 [Gymnopilus junonius]
MALLVVSTVLAVLLLWSRVLAAESQALHAQRYSLPPIEESTHDIAKDHSLLDIVLVSSVDGKFHALNRTSGHVLWSMSSFATTTSVSAPSSLSPLIRTTHPKYDPDFADDDSEDGQHETYIIEPQSGDIYVLHSPSSPLQRFPFSMAELVDISPFTSETSLLLIELETGKIKATLNAECPFIPDEYQDTPIDLDELEGSKPPISAPTEVYIGRTDYIISIHKKPKPGKPAPPAQELSFSTYGPNNKDNHLQAIYRRTPDDMYIQPLTNGEIVAFRAKDENSKDGEVGRPLWGQHFTAPIVAIFDILQSQSSPLQHPSHPFVLLQPRPRLQDLFPKLTGSGLPDPILRNMGTAFVGLVDGTESLFVMSPDRYPLVVFGGAERHGLPAGENRKHEVQEKSLSPGEHHEPDLDHCLDNPYDPLCLIGSMGSPAWNAGTAEDGDNLSNPSVLSIQGPGRPSANILGTIGSGSEHVIGGIWEAVIVSLLFGAFTFWIVWAKVKAAMSKGVGKVQDEKEVVVPPVVEGDGNAFANVQINAITEPLETSASDNLGTEPSTPKALSPPLPALDDAPTPTAKKDLPPPLPIPSTPATPSFDLPTAGLETPTPGAGDEGDDISEGEGIEPGTSAGPGKRRNRRGKRGNKKRKQGAVAGTADGDSAEKDDKDQGDGEAPKEEEKKPPSLVLTTSSSKPPVIQPPSLIVSDTILGFGSHGTVVFQGSLQGRAVAVKRLLQDFVTLAAREVSILQESDDHPNVIRYYYQESHGNFLYIALELCPASLADIIENPDREQWRDIAINFDPKKALKQITSGLRHLHALKLVHRDIKPQNILVSSAKSGGGFGAGSRGGAYRMLISDFGLCKKLDVDQTSFLPTAHGAMGAGTVGWRAPEILGGKVKLDEPSPGDDGSLSSRGSVATINGNNTSVGSSGSTSSSSTPNRLTKSVDIFALGCLFYYTLTNGGHPYGDRFEREVNIMKDCKDLSGLERFGEEGTEAKNLISAMLSFEAPQRPDTTTCLLHPFFWDPGRRLTFLQDASDRFEIMCRDPKDAHLLTLEKDALSVVGNDWHARLDKIFIENLGKYRKYDGKSVQDLLRALRNKKHHYQDLPDNVKRHLGPMPEGFLGYFTRRYPQLFLHVHGVIRETGLSTESMFRTYFELPDS